MQGAKPGGLVYVFKGTDAISYETINPESPQSLPLPQPAPRHTHILSQNVA